MIINWGAGQDFFGEYKSFSIGQAADSDVIFYITGSEIRNNRSTILYGGSIINKNRGQNRFVDTSTVLNQRFDDYQYYQDMGA